MKDCAQVSTSLGILPSPVAFVSMVQVSLAQVEDEKLMTISSFVAMSCGRASFEPAGRWQLPEATI